MKHILFCLLVAVFSHSALGGNPFFDPNSGAKIGTGWPSTSIGGKDGVIYNVDGNNNLKWYKLTARWSEIWAPGAGQVIGTDWDFIYLLGGHDQVFYTVNSNGDLLWHKHLEGQDWHPKSKTVVGRGGWRMSRVFGGAKGVIFAIENGELKRYHHLGDPDKGIDGWAPGSGEVIGRGWEGFDLLTADADNNIYARDGRGVLHYYRYNASTKSWDIAGWPIGNGWGEFSQLFAGPNGRLFAVAGDGRLLKYEIANKINDRYNGSDSDWRANKRGTGTLVFGNGLKQCLDLVFKPDGCSFDVKGVTEYWDTQFDDACRSHDYCYATTGRTKKICDDSFKENMTKVCNRLGTDDCKSARNNYHTGVVLFGQSSWDGAAISRDDWCFRTD